MQLILSVTGTPSESFIERMGAERVKTYLHRLPTKQPVPLTKIFPKAHPEAVDLLSQMLQLDPTKRIKVEDALKHPFVKEYHNIDDEPSCYKELDFAFDDVLMTKEALKGAIRKEIEDFQRKRTLMLSPVLSAVNVTTDNVAAENKGKDYATSSYNHPQKD